MLRDGLFLHLGGTAEDRLEAAVSGLVTQGDVPFLLTMVVLSLDS
jgi:hypothetical protein